MLSSAIADLTALAKVLGLAGGVAASLAAIAVVFKRPVKWTYTQLFGEPVGEWARAQVGAVVDEKLLKRNGGTTVPDAIARIDRLAAVVEKYHIENEQHHRDNVDRLEAIESGQRGMS